MFNKRVIIRRFLLLLYLTVTAFLIADILKTFMVQGLTAPTSVQHYVPSDSALASPTNIAAISEQILAAGLFPLSPGGGTVRNDQVKSVDDAGRKVRLIGTVVADGRVPLAILEELVTKKQRLYRLHEQIPDVGEVIQVSQNGITVQIGAEHQFLPATIAGGLSSSVPPTAGRSIAVTGGDATVRRAVDRREVASSMKDLPKLLSLARAVPYYENGNLNGWRIEALAARSLFEKIGLEAGDVLQRVNGVVIHDPSMMLTLLQQVKDENQVQLDVMRKKRKMTFLYEIR